jgi:hypothetical protein
MNVRLVINPESDTRFAGEVEAAMESGLSETDELQCLLRFEHPQATVTNGVREPDGRERWYVYRDGHWRA